MIRFAQAPMIALVSLAAFAAPLAIQAEPTGKGCRAQATGVYDAAHATAASVGVDPATLDHTAIYNEAEKEYNKCREQKGKDPKKFHLGPQQIFWR